MMDKSKLQEILDYYENKDNHEKHLKGYMYDSLVYRYKEALYKAHLYDAMLEGKGNCSFKKERYLRDLMRFIQILDEGLGEHD